MVEDLPSTGNCIFELLCSEKEIFFIITIIKNMYIQTQSNTNNQVFSYKCFLL